MPVRLMVTAGTTADCTQALPLMEGIAAECLLADKAYDTNEIVAAAVDRGINPVIPPKSNRREKREYDRALYRLRHLVENGFLDFKQWRGVATRYAKNSLSYLAVCQIRALALWTRLL
jgi:transposase